MLTNEELRAAIDRAREYPAGNGYKWGWGDLGALSDGVVFSKIRHGVTLAYG